MAKSSTTWQSGHVAPSHTGRKSKAELYKRPVRQAEKKIVNVLPSIVDNLIAIALGEATEHIVNHKTGTVEEVPVNPKTQASTAQYLLDRIAGKPETKKVHELGDDARQGLQILLGGEAAAHWAQFRGPDLPGELPAGQNVTVKILEAETPVEGEFVEKQ